MASKARMTVVERLYYGVGQQQIHGAETAFCRDIDTEEQHLDRRHEVGPEPTPLPMYWLQSLSHLLIVNLDKTYPLYITLGADGHIAVPPGESCRFQPASTVMLAAPNTIKVRVVLVP